MHSRNNKHDFKKNSSGNAAKLFVNGLITWKYVFYSLKSDTAE